MKFILVDCDVDDNKRVMEFFGITDESCPTMRAINNMSMAQFTPDNDDLTFDAIYAFIDEVLDRCGEIADNFNNAVKVYTTVHEELAKECGVGRQPTVAINGADAAKKFSEDNKVR